MKYVKNGTGEIRTYKDYSKQIIFRTEDFFDRKHLLQTVTIPPNTKQRKHYHRQQTEVFFILEGECSIFINDTEFTAKPGDAFICEPGDRHFLWNKSDKEFRLAVFKINFDEKADDTKWLDHE